MTEARTYPAGVTSWIDVEVDDVEAAQEFYGGLFGWTFTQVTPPGIPAVYVIAQLDGQDVAGIGGPATPTGRRRQAAWNTYVAVDDIEAAVATVEARGRSAGRPRGAGRRGRLERDRRRPGRRRVPAVAGQEPARRTAHQRARLVELQRPGGGGSGSVEAVLRTGLRLGVRRPGLRHDDPGGPGTATTSPPRPTRTSTSDSQESTRRRGSPTPSAGSARRHPTWRPAGTSPSPWPTATRPPPGSRSSAAGCCARTTPTGRRPPSSWTRRGHSSPRASSPHRQS